MKGPPAASPDAYVEALSGWRRDGVEMLRAAINAGATFDEIIKWHNLIFVSNGLCILIHTEEDRILLGFWRGSGSLTSTHGSSRAVNMSSAM